MATTTLRRVFKHGSIELPDPALTMTPAQVRDSYAATYPELATAIIKGPDHASGKETYTFKASIGTKG